MQRIINPALAKANMSKTELGARLGVTQQNISKRIQRGKFTLDELQEIARCMGAEFNCSFDFPDGTKIGTKESDICITLVYYIEYRILL